MTKQELINFLSTCEKKHVDELVDILTAFGKGRLTLNSTVKDVLIYAKQSLKPYSQKEIELLITEFQKFAGNSIANRFRNNDELVSYSEILTDVYKILCLNDSKNLNSLSDSQKEEIIVKIFHDNWKNLSFEEKNAVSSKLRLVLKGNLNTNNISSTVCLLTKINPIMAGISGVAAAASEAYRITIPFIVQIAWLKLYEKEKSKLTTPELKISINQPILIDENEQTALSLIEYVEQPDFQFKEQNKSNISAFNQLFSNLPSLATKYETVKNHIVSINIDPAKLTAAKDGNGWRGMVHGYNENGHFGITENVRIFEADKLKQIVNSGVLMNLASTVVAQKHLADINQKLKELKQSVDDIKSFLHDERKSKIEATINQIKLISDHLKKGHPIPKNEKHILNEQMKSNLEIKIHLEKDLEKARVRIKAIKFNSFMGKNNTKDLKLMFKEIKLWEQLYKEYQLCCSAIMMTYAIYYFTSKSTSDKELYLSATKNLVKETSDLLETEVIDLITHLKQAHKNSKGLTNFDTTDEANEAFFLGNIQGFTLYQTEIREYLQQTVQSLNEIKPLQVALLIENGQVVNSQIMEYLQPA